MAHKCSQRAKKSLKHAHIHCKHHIVISVFSHIQEWFYYFSWISLYNLFYYYDPILVSEFYATQSPYCSTNFSTTLVLRGKSFTFSIDDILRILSLPDVKDPSFPSSLFAFKNLTSLKLCFKFSFIAKGNISSIADQLVGLFHTYSGGALTINKDVPSFHLNNVVIAVTLFIPIIRLSPIVWDTLIILCIKRKKHNWLYKSKIKTNPSPK